MRYSLSFRAAPIAVTTVAMLTLCGCSSAQSMDGATMTNAKQIFETQQSLDPWRAVNDGVMGGKSSGGPQFKDGHMVFSGVINTDGGGFSSIRTQVDPGTLSGTTGMALRVRSDGRQYKLTFRTDVTHRFRQVSFQAPLAGTTTGDWSDITVNYADLKPSVFGRPLSDKVFDPNEVREMGIIIADGKDGPFELHIESLTPIAGK